MGLYLSENSYQACEASFSRTATVVAKTPVRVFRIDRQAFDRVISAAFRRGTLVEHSTVARTAQH